MLAQLFALVEELLGGKASAIPLPGAAGVVGSVGAGAEGALGAANASTSRERFLGLALFGIGREPLAFTPPFTPPSSASLDPRADSAGFPQPRLIEALTAGAAVHMGGVHTGPGRSQQAAVAVGVHSKLGGDAYLCSRTQAALCALRLLYVHLLGLRRAALDIGALTELGLQTKSAEPPLFFRVCC